MKKQPPRYHETDLPTLVHELETHQLELEIQNEELRRAQVELTASHEKYAELYDFAPIGYFTFDSRGTIKSLNVTGAELLGRGKRQLINTSFVRFVAKEDQYAFRDHLRNTLQGQQKHTCELRLTGTVGAALTVELQSILSQIAAGDGLECRSAVIDISKRKIAESELKEVSHQYEVVLESAGDGILGLDWQGNHTFANSAAARMLGYRREELTGRHSHLLWHHTRSDGTPYPEAECNIYRTLRDGVARHVDDEVFWKKNGSGFPVEYIVTPIYEDGKIAGAVISYRDITNQKEAREALRESEARIRGLASTALDAVILIDNDGKVSFWNEAAAKMFGYAQEEIMGKYLHAYTMPERYHDRFMKGFKTFQSTGEGLFIGTVYETEGKRKDGTEFPVELSLSAVKLKEKWCAIGIVRDITERRRSEKELKKAMDDLARSNKELDQFAAIASHDLRAPLRTVRSYLDFLAEDYKEKLDAQASQYINRATNAAMRMTDLIGSLYLYARVGTHGKEFRPTDMNEVVRHAVENLKKEIEDSKAEISQGQFPRVEGDNIQLVQLFQNLIGNAIKFRKKDEAPRISLSAVQRENEWLFTIRDNGIGIDDPYFEQIFLIFHRLHTAEEYAGTGMGLALCKKIVERHGGRIWVESVPGQGSAFHFTIPAKNL